MQLSEYDYIAQITLGRKELYELVWKEPTSEISKKYYISESTLIKRCQELNIPLPNLKYWVKLKDPSDPPPKTPLPPFSGNRYLYLKLRSEVEKVRDNLQKKHSHFKKEIESDPNVKLKVPEKLTNPDPLIAAARDKLLKKEVYQKNQGIIFQNQASISVFVSPAQISRALRFMDTMIKALKARGHLFIFKNGHTHVVIYGEDYWISCKEKEKRIIVKEKYGDRTKLEPTGNLSFRMGESYYLKEWSEGKTPIEEQVSKILAGIEYTGWKDNQERIEREKQWAIRDEEERQAKILQQRKQKELADFKDLFVKSKRHEDAEMIRRYVAKLEQSAIERNDLTDQLKQFINWARQKANWYDPFIEAPDELLNEVNKEELGSR